jgi:hypothetical protein
VSEKGLFLQNIIAVIWDFDRTLSPHYMQRPLFEAYSIEEDRFWAEVNALPAYYERAGISIDTDTAYLGHLLAYVREGRMKDLTNQRLREIGRAIELFPGVPECFGALRRVVAKPEFNSADLRVEHYIVSTGLKALIEGTAVAKAVNGIWACEFIETPAHPGDDLSATPASAPISQIASILDNTTKTRAIFEINKGVNVSTSVSVNDSIPYVQRRVPFEQMIYIADGPSDIPSFSVMRRHGGLTFAVYDPNERKHYKQALALREAERVDHFGPADFRPESETMKWLEVKVEGIAQRILDQRRSATERSVKRAPTHG